MRGHYTLLETPFGWIGVLAGDAGLRHITVPHVTTSAAHDEILRIAPDAREDATPFGGLADRLLRYFAGERIEFPDALDLSGATAFQRAVYAELRAVPYGATATYSEIARRVGRPHASRAVGRLNATNPWPIIMPCHRLIGSDGSLHGYAGGLSMKQALLDLERGLLHHGDLLNHRDTERYVTAYSVLRTCPQDMQYQ